MIETRLLHYFLAVAREQTITRAAETLHLTQSTLSKQMMDLERQLGKQLFIRGKRRLTLTEEGNFLRHKAQEILELIGSTESAFHTEGEILSGDITIGCGETAAMDRIAAVYQAFHRQHPEVRLHTFSGDAESVLERLDRGLVDMGLLLGPIRQERFDYLNIHQKDTFGLLMPRDRPLAGQDAIGVEQLGSLLLILSKQTFSGRQELDWFGVDSGALQVVATYNLVYNATFLVERGIGYALCLEGLVNTQGRDLTFRPIEPELSVGLYIATKKYQTFSPAVKAFLEQVREAVG
ncbi:LysR family transcriptional regulator [Bittarella massiliensis (ex Durand et al. 2017)]|uniref:LysR family transcriptional regulator n=1 Tax=Bittarella massiliensis (ex Durand et al. 2017) TaxID=1720313 RepID=UPI001FB7D6AF|nr:LysR family transcriptional regulator [Bittarella massiliensis (ex Durand et al. 2017)]MBO1680593.1 LysR family transcriptional regulator [Bittarella massiliensis (ex Durand et al. 2017)]